MSEKEPIFIIGAPRSGTTFLASLLEHTDYGAPFETQFIVKYYKNLYRYGDITEFKNFKNLLDAILHERSIMQFKPKVEPMDLFLELGNKFTYTDLVNKLCLSISSNKGKKYWGDKTPSYILNLDIIDKIFPNSKYLYIVRDGRDVALSLLKKNWGPNNFYSCAQYWNDCNSKISLTADLQARGRLLQIRYEDLIDDMENHVRKIYHFLDVEFDENVVSKMASQAKTGNYYKWRGNMSKNQVYVFDTVAYKTLKYFNYETTNRRKILPTYKKLLFSAHNIILQNIHLFKLNVIDGIKIKYFGKEPFTE